ncbi:hypothetical protein VTH82DRAFT_3327 [Thermothelomyces myriococcoides]
MHTNLVDQIIVYADVAIWRMRDLVRLLEKTRLDTGPIFGPTHELSRHTLHLSEVLEATLETLTTMQACQAAVRGKLKEDLGETYREQAQSYVQFQISLMKSLKLRSDSNHRRLENEIDLIFNNIARQDNRVMKSIALLGMIFLPSTFISAIFSTTFFNFDEESNAWEVSDKIWIFLVTAIPATIITIVLWFTWLSWSGPFSFLSWTKHKQALERQRTRKERKAKAQPIWEILENS